MTLTSVALAQDPRMEQAKRLLLDTVKDHQLSITGVRPPDSSLKHSYEKLVEEFSESRGGKLWYPYIGSGMGNGALVELLDGSIKYDMICGIGPHFFGHCHPLLIEACIDAALGNTVMQGHLQQNEDSITLSRLLIETSGLDHCFLTTSGVMANENALKIAFQNKTPASRVLAFDHCFAGRSLSMSAITDKPNFREGLPLLLQVDYIPYYDPLKPQESTAEAANTLKKHLARYPKEHAVMIFELVQGEGGFYSGTRDFFKSLIDILKEHGILVLVDEVQSFGRTPELFATRYFGLQDDVDMITIGKVSQVCATLFRSELKPRPGLLSQTFTASTSAIRAAKAIITRLLSDDFYGPKGKIAALHRHFVQNLEAVAERHPHLIRGPWGIGSMIAFTPYDGEMHKVMQFSHRLFDAGVIGFIAGSHPSRIRFLIPAGAITTHDIDEVTRIVEKTLTEGV